MTKIFKRLSDAQHDTQAEKGIESVESASAGTKKAVPASMKWSMCRFAMPKELHSLSLNSTEAGLK